MKKKDEIQTPTSCLNKAGDDEPIFVLRAKDSLGATVVRYWAQLAAVNHVHEVEKIAEARNLADMMDQWRADRKP